MEYPAGIATAIAAAKVRWARWCCCRPSSSASWAWPAVSLVMNIVQMVWLWVVLHNKVLVAEERRAERPMGQKSRGRGLSLSLGLRPRRSSATCSANPAR